MVRRFAFLPALIGLVTGKLFIINEFVVKYNGLGPGRTGWKGTGLV